MGSEFEIDNELVELTKAGKREAYDQLYARHSSKILSMLILRCGEQAIAQDLVQEAFIRAFVNIDKFDTRYSFGGWIYTIARNLHTDYKRRLKSNSDEIDGEIPCCQPNPEQKIISNQNNQKIEQAIEQLPQHYRVIFDLRYMQELSYEEIATRLDIPLGTVKTHIHRARERFLRELGVTRF